MKLKILAAMALLMLTVAATAQRGPGPRAVPKFEPDPFWPKPLPNKWMMGQVGGTYVDSHDHLWVTRNGKFLLQIGHHGKSGGNNDTENLNRPAGIVVYPKTNEVFVADGYNNRRVIVFDADTGAFKRMWGAYGNKPDDNAPRTRL